MEHRELVPNLNHGWEVFFVDWLLLLAIAETHRQHLVNMGDGANSGGPNSIWDTYGALWVTCGVASRCLCRSSVLVCLPCLSFLWTILP